MKRLLTYVVAILAVMFTGQLVANPAAYAAAAPTVKQCQDAYKGLTALQAAGWPAYVIAANKSIIDQKCAGVYIP
jgi:hypothetical protein